MKEIRVGEKLKDCQKCVIFSDCFNTLICRTKHPDDVLYDWAIRMNGEYSEMSPESFFQLFKSVWRELERRDVIEIENCEFLMNIKEIFFKMFEIISQYRLLSALDEIGFIEIAEKNYFNAEAESHYLNKSVMKFLQKQKLIGKKIYIVSDFYCSKDFIEKWILKLGVNEKFFDDIFVSCDFKKSKKTGSLYAELLDKLNLSPKCVTMMGDNLISDRQKARKYNIKTKFVKPYLGRQSRLLKKTKHKIIVPEEYKKLYEKNKADNIYINYCFPLYLFVKRLYQHCVRHNIQEVYFLAREGKLLKVLFDEFLKMQESEIKTHYFIASRSSILNATLLPYETKFKKLANWTFMSPRNFMLSLNFPQSLITEICKEINIKERMFHHSFERSRAYKKLLNSEKFNQYYLDYSKQQNNALWRYANNCGITNKTENLFIVDSGWHGSMQKYLSWFLNDKVNIYGGYIGADFKGTQNKKYYSFVFSKKEKLGTFNKVLSYRWLNYEEVLRTADGSCKKYDAETGTPVLDDRVKEQEYYDKYIKQFQNKVLQAFTEICSIDKCVYSNLESVVSYMFYKMISQACGKDRQWYDLVQSTYVDTFGFVGYSYKYFGSFIRKTNFRVRDFLFKLKYRHAFKKKRLFWN